MFLFWFIIVQNSVVQEGVESELEALLKMNKIVMVSKNCSRRARILKLEDAQLT